MSESEQHEQPVFDGLTITEHARRAAESLRAINHLTVGPELRRSLVYPQDVWSVISELHSLAQRLEQTFQQLDHGLVAIAESGRVRGLQEALGERPLAVLGCGAIIIKLERALREASAYTSQLSYDIAEDWPA